MIGNITVTLTAGAVASFTDARRSQLLNLVAQKAEAAVHEVTLSEGNANMLVTVTVPLAVATDDYLDELARIADDFD